MNEDQKQYWRGYSDALGTRVRSFSNRVEEVKRAIVRSNALMSQSDAHELAREFVCNTDGLPYRRA